MALLPHRLPAQLTAQLTALHAACLLAALPFASAHAARPMTADDASTLDPQQCQLESWVQHNHDQTEFWAVPACNLGGGWELAAGAAHVHRTAAGRAASGPGTPANLAILQAKTLLRKPQGDGWGVGLVLADLFRPAQDMAGDWFANVPVSVELLGERLVAHVNAGWLKERGKGSQATWAAGLEAMAGLRGALTVEAYGRQRGGAFFQLGGRYALLPGRADLDAGYGERTGLHGRERFVTVGLTLYAGM